MRTIPYQGYYIMVLTADHGFEKHPAAASAGRSQGQREPHLRALREIRTSPGMTWR